MFGNFRQLNMLDIQPFDGFSVVAECMTLNELEYINVETLDL